MLNFLHLPSSLSHSRSLSFFVSAYLSDLFSLCSIFSLSLSVFLSWICVKFGEASCLQLGSAHIQSTSGTEQMLELNFGFYTVLRFWHLALHILGMICNSVCSWAWHWVYFTTKNGDYVEQWSILGDEAEWSCSVDMGYNLFDWSYCYIWKIRPRVRLGKRRIRIASWVSKFSHW